MNPFEVRPPNVLNSLMMGVEGFKSGRAMRQQSELEGALKIFGETGDLDGTARRLAQSGNVDAAIKFIGLAQSQRKEQRELQTSRDLASAIGGNFPGVPGSGMPPASGYHGNIQPGAAVPPQVLPTNRVWGDEEAEKAGLYEPGAGSVAAAIPQEYRGYVQALAANPATRKEALDLVGKFIDPKISFSVIGQDQYGTPQYGFVDTRTKSVTPFNMKAGVQAGPAVIPAPPPGVDPRKWREQQTERYLDSQLPPKDTDVTGLRKEVRSLPSYKNLSEVSPRIQAMQSAALRDNRAADLTLVYGLMKILDPASVVRESEAEMAQNVATLPQKYRQQVESFLKGSGRLAPEVRQAMLEEALAAGNAYHQRFESDIAQFRGIAQRNRMNVDDIIPSFSPFQNATQPDVGAMRRQGADALRKKYGLE